MCIRSFVMAEQRQIRCCCQTGGCCTLCIQSVCCIRKGGRKGSWCSERKSCCRRKHCSRRNCLFFRDVGILYLLTFLVALPVLTLNLRHTAFDFLKHRNVTTENARMLRENAERYNQSLLLLNNLVEKQSRGESKILRNLLEQRHKQGIPFHNNSQCDKKGLAITVITVSRSVVEDEDPHYLTQIVARFLRLFHENERILTKHSIHFSICNVDPKPNVHTEVRALPEWIPVYTRYQNRSRKPQNYPMYTPILNKEKDDYAYCLDMALGTNLSHVLLVEDDALPREELFVVLDNLVLSRGNYSTSASENVAYYKLYHPERLLGYISLDFERIPELLSSSLILSCVLLLIYTRWRTQISTSRFIMWLSLFIYSCLLFLAIGRVNLIEFRRLSRYLYQMTPSPSCCTPAMLFTRDGGKRISEFLKTVIDRTKFAKDMAIDEYRHTNKLVTRFIQPNLFKHIGHVSSLRRKLLDPYIV